ncbi:MAG: hypothetical protein JSS10_00240 [Verrucomicrobia bacterium]|nr:hypothetical protein [Verrucomicrobiota bacterium]
MIEQGRQALEKQDEEAFKRLYRKAHDNNDHQALHALGKLALEKGLYQEASVCFANESMATSAGDATPYFWRNVAELRFGGFYIVKDNCDKALEKDESGNPKVKNLDKRMEAQLHLQRAHANLALSAIDTVQGSIEEAIRLYPATSKASFQAFKRWLPIFREDDKYFPSQSRFLAQAEYLNAVLLFMEGKVENIAAICEQAINRFSDSEDLALKIEILAFWALAHCEGQQYDRSIQIAKAALLVAGSSKASKETLVTLHFCLAVSYSAQKKFTEAFQNFENALNNIHADPLLRQYILLHLGCCYRAAAKEQPDRKISWYQSAETAFNEASKPLSNTSFRRGDHLVRCMLWSLGGNLKYAESPQTRLNGRIARARIS